MGLRSPVLGYWPDDGQSYQAGQRRTLGLALERRASRHLYGAGSGASLVSRMRQTLPDLHSKELDVDDSVSGYEGHI